MLQLLNAQDPDTNEVIAFSNEYVDLVASLASQAAVALTNTQLIQDLTDLFYSFIKGIATAIDAKSSYTGGHINRVVFIAMLLLAGNVFAQETSGDLFSSNWSCMLLNRSTVVRSG